MRSTLLTSLVLVALTASATADGFVAPYRGVVKPVRTPDQRALLRFDGTTETLVIETTLQGEGRDFAWIVPLPAPPKIEASTTGLFPTLAVMCGPEVLDEEVDYRLNGPCNAWLFVVAVGLGGWATIRWGRRPIPLRFAILFVPALLGAAWWRADPDDWRHTLKGPPGSASPVTVISHQQVGLFDTVTLDAPDPAALREWLDVNGFQAPAAIDPVVAQYISEGWVFVASKVRRDADDDAVRRIHPLAFTFPSKAAVYPMRLTGAANESMALELYVAGERRAEVEGLNVEDCDDSHAAELDPTSDPCFWSSSMTFEHSETWRRCAGAKVITKLSGVLDRAAMAHDLAIRWVDYEPKQITYFTLGAARERSKLPASIAFAVTMIVAAIVGRRRAIASARRATFHDLVWPTSALLFAGVASNVACIAAPLLPAGGTYLGRGSRGVWAGDVLRDPPASIRGDAAAVRAWAHSKLEGATNWEGAPIREEDSPGNWYVREQQGRVELVVSPWGLQDGALDLSRLESVEGTVRGPDGRPVRGASVRLQDSTHDRHLEPGFRYDYPLIEVLTDDRGRFHFEDVPHGGTWLVSVVFPGLANLDRSDVRSTPGHSLDLVLSKGWTVRGHVVDASGMRPANVWVCCTSGERPLDSHWDAREAPTDDDGGFEFTGLDAENPQLRPRLHVHSPRHCDEVLLLDPSMEGRDVELRLADDVRPGHEDCPPVR